jgi:hypothetical protein
MFPNLAQPSASRAAPAPPGGSSCPSAELLALGQLALLQPWGAGRPGTSMQQLRGQATSWCSALAALGPAFQLKCEKQVAMGCGLAHQAQKSKGLALPLVLLNWVETAHSIDPQLVEQVYGPSRRFCWHCGAAGSPAEPLLQCSGCKQASFCSKECQRQAWWWHKRGSEPREAGGQRDFACRGAAGSK